MRVRKCLWLLVLFPVLVLVMTSGCQKEEPIDTYTNEEYGYTFEIPEIWKEKINKIEIIEQEEGRIVTFAYLFGSEGSEHQQDFFTISIMSKIDYEKELIDLPYTGDILGEDNEQVYVHYPTLDNIILDRETIDEYNEMNLSLDKIKGRFSLNADKELLSEEIIDLKTKISKKDEEINRLRKVISGKDAELKELGGSLNMVRFSSYARLNDYHSSFDNLGEIYRINSKYEIKDDWYLINDDYFEIELLEYEDASQVDFYTLRLESGEGAVLNFSDTDYSDGWMYTNDSIGKIIEKHNSSRGFSYEPYFVIYAEVTLEDGNIMRTPKLPVYYR